VSLGVCALWVCPHLPLFCPHSLLVRPSLACSLPTGMLLPQGCSPTHGVACVTASYSRSVGWLMERNHTRHSLRVLEPDGLEALCFP
jgi:hypothetical protein